MDWYKETLFHAANEQGISHARRGEGAKARAAWQQAEAVVEELARRHPGSGDYQASLATVSAALGPLARSEGRTAETLPYFRKALAIYERLCGDYPKVVPYLYDRNSSRTLRAGLLADTG